MNIKSVHHNVFNEYELYLKPLDLDRQNGKRQNKKRKRVPSKVKKEKKKRKK